MKRIILSILFCILLAANVSAYAPKENYVKLISNTDECFIDCYSVYEITASDRTLVIKPDNTYFKFKTWQDKNKRDPWLVDGLYEIQYYLNTGKDWEIFDKTVTVPKDQSILIKVEGKKFPEASIDNILHIKIKPKWLKFEFFTREYSYDQWVWWNANYQYKRPLTGCSAARSLACFNTTAYKGEEAYNTSRIVKDETDEIGFIWERNQSSEKEAQASGANFINHSGGVFGQRINFTATGDDTEFWPLNFTIINLKNGFGGADPTGNYTISIHKMNLSYNYLINETVCYGFSNVSGIDAVTERDTALNCMQPIQANNSYFMLVNMSNVRNFGSYFATGNPYTKGEMHDGCVNLAGDTWGQCESDTPAYDLYFRLEGVSKIISNKTENLCFVCDDSSTYNYYYSNTSGNLTLTQYQWSGLHGWNDSSYDINTTTSISTITVGAEIIINQGPIIYSNVTFPEVPQMYQNITVRINATDLDSYVDYVNVTVLEDGVEAYNLSNITKETEVGMWNYSFLVKATTLYRVEIRATDDEGGFDFTALEFTPHNTTLTYPDPAPEVTLQNFLLEANYNVSEALLNYSDQIYNATREVYTQNYSRFNVTVPINFTLVNDTKPFHWNFTNNLGVESNRLNTSEVQINVSVSYFIDLRTDLIDPEYTSGEEIDAQYNMTNFSGRASVTHEFAMNDDRIAATLNTTYTITEQNYEATPVTPNGIGINFTLAGVLTLGFNGTTAIRTSNVSANITPTSLTINVLSENTGLLIQPSQVTADFTSNATSFSRVTTTGIITEYALNQTVFNILFSSVNYTSRSYIVTTGNTTPTNLTVYLPINTTSQTTFTVTDKDTGAVIENALISMLALFNGTWQVVQSRYSDVTGKAPFDYIENKKYKFLLTKIEYKDYIFYLDPILYSEYSVQMEKSTLINYSQDFDKLSIIYDPTSFDNGTEADFNMIITSPTGLLLEYGYNLTEPSGVTDSQVGSNAIGGQLTSTITPNASSVYDTVIFDYYYITTLSGRRNFTALLPINFGVGAGVGNMTFMANKNKTYGLGIFERMLMITIAVILVVGIASMVGQPIPGFVLGLMTFGYSVYVGFIPIWGVLPSMFIGIIFLMWKSGG